MHLLVSKDHGVSGKALVDTKGTAVSRKLDGSSTGGRSGVTTSPKGSSIMGEKTEKPQEVLPCPRCQSMNTKFCYYNNYSVNQPRYFCRQCQRYWTVGGTLRNVPVGGGSRKKNRRGVTEPYPRRSSAAETTPLAMATPGMSPTMSFQQFLANDVPGSFLFSQTGPYGVYPVVDQSGQGIQYLTPPMYGQSGALGDNNCFPDLSAGTTLQGNDQSSVGVKTELRGSSHMNMAQHQPVWDSSQAINQSQSDPGSKPGCDSSMLLQLGLTNRPVPESGASAGTKGPVWNEVAPKNSSSPPHGSSTIEEEGNTPTNCYSNNGYEEGDAVSSMWAQNMQDMQDILSSTL